MSVAKLRQTYPDLDMAQDVTLDMIDLAAVHAFRDALDREPLVTEDTGLKGEPLRRIIVEPDYRVDLWSEVGEERWAIGVLSLNSIFLSCTLTGGLVPELSCIATKSTAEDRDADRFRLLDGIAVNVAWALAQRGARH